MTQHLTSTFIAQTLRMSIPYVCAGLGGVWSEKSGVPNIALEGILLASGLAGAASQVASENAWVGVGAAIAVGGAVGLIHALLSARARVDAIVSGLAINIAAAGGTRFTLRALYDSSSNSPAIAGIRLANVNDSSLLVRTIADPILWATCILTIATTFVFYRTRFGLRIRACGEDPVASQSVGVNVVATRTIAISLGGAICGLGGVALAFDQHQFQSGMSGGRGFIALAAVILSGWRPTRAAFACVAFAALDAAQVVLQNRTGMSPYALQMVPYVCTLVALFAMSGRRAGSSAARAPMGMGKHAD